MPQTFGRQYHKFHGELFCKSCSGRVTVCSHKTATVVQLFWVSGLPCGRQVLGIYRTAAQRSDALQTPFFCFFCFVGILKSGLVARMVVRGLFT